MTEKEIAQKMGLFEDADGCGESFYPSDGGADGDGDICSTNMTPKEVAAYTAIIAATKSAKK